MQSTTTLELNLQYPNHATTMYAVQNDRLSRKVSAVLADGATAWTPPTGSLAIVRFAKPDGTMGFYDTDENDDPAVTWTGNVATITLAEQVLTVAGDVWCQVNFYNAGEERLSTFKWVIKVQENVITDETIESTDYFNILTHEIDEILETVAGMPSPSTTTPKMDGTASAGTENSFARGDHRHPKDTSKVSTSTTVNDKALSSNITINASDIPNDSTVSGEKVDDALETLGGILSGIDYSNVQGVSTANENLNNYTNGGIYYFSSSYTPVNKPSDSGSYGFLVVIKGSSLARMVQYWIDTASSSNVMWMRSNSSTTVSWGDWKRFILNSDLVTETLTPSVVETLPTGITSVSVFAVKSGNVVSVYLYVDRDSTTISSYVAIATGLPTPKIRPSVSGVTIPNALLPVSGVQSGRYLFCIVNASGDLRVRYGETAGAYYSSFSYITDEI